MAATAPRGGVPHEEGEADEEEQLDEAVEHGVDEGAVGRGHALCAGDAPVEDVAHAREAERPAAELEPADGDGAPGQPRPERGRRSCRSRRPGRAGWTGWRRGRRATGTSAARSRPSPPRNWAFLLSASLSRRGPRSGEDGHGDEQAAEHGQERGRDSDTRRLLSEGRSRVGRSRAPARPRSSEAGPRGRGRRCRSGSSGGSGRRARRRGPAPSARRTP